MHAANAHSSEDKRRLGYLFLSAFVLRAALALIRYNPWLGGDSHAYVQMAEWLKEGTSSVILGHPPVYPLFLLGVYTLPHNSTGFSLLMQAFVSALSVILTYRISRRWATPAASLVAAGIVALDPFQIYFSSLFLSETLFIFLLLAGFSALIELEQSPKMVWAVLSGFLFALGALCRTILSPFLPLLALSIFFIRRAALARSIALAVVFTIGAALPIAAWSVYLHQRTGHWVLVAPQRGWNCYEGLNPDFDQPEAVRQWQLGMWRDIEREGLKNPVEMDHYFWAKTVATVKRQPLATLILMIRKFFKFWRFWPYFPYSLRERIISAIFMSFLVPFAVLGLWESRKIQNAAWPIGLLASFIAVYTIANTITWTEIRYRVPLHPLVAVFSGIGFIRFISLIKERKA